MSTFTKYLVLFFVGLSIIACSPKEEPMAQPKQQQPKIALALGGGAAKGFSHVGVIKVLEKEGIHIDIITGTSVGAFVGSIYADGRTAKQLEKEALALGRFKVADFSLSNKGLIKGNKLQKFINKKVDHKPLEALSKKMGIVATNLETGEMTIFEEGDTGQLVRASVSIPSIFQPALVGGKYYVDGGLSAPVPVRAAKKLGADIVIAVDISAKPKSDLKVGLVSVFSQTINIMSLTELKNELSQADVVIRPDISELSSASFKHRKKAIEEGEVAAEEAVAAIKEAIARFNEPKDTQEKN